MYFIGLDIGTTGAKAILVDKNGEVHGKGYAGYSLISNGCRIEQRADDWIECGSAAIRCALKNNKDLEIAAVSISAQGSSVVAIDKQNQPIGNALTWMDTRAEAEATALEKHLGSEYIYRNTGWKVSPSLDAAKIMYMKRSGTYNSAARFLSAHEYMNLFLTGNPVCDPSNSSIRQIYNVTGRDYDEKILNAIGVRRDELPEVLPTGSLVGSITKDAAAATDLRPGIPVYNGAHDQYCASIGIGAVKKGDLLLSAGTTWVIMGIDDKPLFTDSYIASAIHPVPGHYGAIASLVGCGGSLQWFKNNFIDDNFEEIDSQAALRSNKTESLFFYPYLSGACYPIWNIKMRGGFLGLELKHDKFDFARVIMEASAFGVRQALEDFTSEGFEATKLLVMGGAAKSEFWCSLIAATANLPIEVSDENEACAIGAAIIAAKGSGAYNSISDAVSSMASVTKRVEKDTELALYMDKKYILYRRMGECIAKYYE